MTLLVVWMGMPMGLLGSCGGPGAGVSPALCVCVGGGGSCKGFWLGWRAQACAHAGLVVCPAASITALLPTLPSTASGTSTSPREVSGVFSTERVDGHADAYWVACPRLYLAWSCRRNDIP